MATIFGTDGNDIIDATYSAGAQWGDRVDAGDGDDFVKLDPGVAFISGPGNDTLIADYMSEYGSFAGAIVALNDPQPSIFDFKNGKIYDAYGCVDTVSDITELHLGGIGGTVYGSGLNEVVFISGGDAKLFMGDGNDEVRVWEQNSSQYTIETAGASTFLFGDDHTIELRDVETIEFYDKTIKG